MMNANRPGLSALAYRVGTHAVFLQTMKARLSSSSLDIPRDTADSNGDRPADRLYPLQGLTTRAADDPAIALLDAWATIADVLTFYQERIANEGYLRTATERRSILELARLVGYALRPGVAASVYLAYTLDDNLKEAVEIAVGSRAQSIPGPGELPQSFETSEVLVARTPWNSLRPRMSEPQRITFSGDADTEDPTDARNISVVYLKGAATNLKPNDALLLVFGEPPGQQVLRRVARIEAQFAGELTKKDRTRVLLQPLTAPPDETNNGLPLVAAVDELSAVLPGLVKPASIPPRNMLRLSRSVAGSFAAKADTSLQVLTALQPELHASLPIALANVTVTQASELKVFALRAKAGPFGNTAPKRPILDDRGAVISTEEWPLASLTIGLRIFVTGNAAPPFQVAISIKRGDHLMTHVESLQAMSDRIITVDGVPVRIKQGQALLPLEIDVQLAEGTRSFVFGPADGALTVTIDGQQWNVDAGKTLRSGIEGHNVFIDYTPTAGRENTTIINLVDETPATLDKHDRSVLTLDGPYDQVVPHSWLAITRTDGRAPFVARVADVQTVSRADYNISARVTRLTLAKDQKWLRRTDRLLSDVRNVTVFAQSEALELAEAPITDDICGGAEDAIELDGLYSGLQSGRWLIVSGERSDIKDAAGNIVGGVRSSELAMLAEVTQAYRPDLPGDRTHTFITLAKRLEYCYKRDAVTIYGNVVKATHGETRSEVLGSGDGGRPLQTFILRQPPLTHVAAPTAAGADSTLKVYVNDVQWQQVDALAGLERSDRRYITRTADDDKTTVIFGTGEQGARPPTGIENIRAVYRNGIGTPGNVQAGQISLLTTRPLGVNEVVNPLRASGGADRESRDQARRNAPLAVLALDRLVSVQDYADFACTFAGVGKAVARRISDGRRELVHVTIAGASDIPIDESSDLYRNLGLALRQYGAPDQPFRLAIRELLLLVISANVQVVPGYLWEPVATKIRCRLLDSFGFEYRELGQNLALSEVLSVIQGVEGVAYADVDVLGGIPEKKAEDGKRRLLTPKEITETVHAILTNSSRKLAPQQHVRVNLADFEDATLRPAQLAFLTPAVPDTLILNAV